MRMDGCEECGKLRTLKEIEWKKGYFIYPKELREEAIKWYKHFNEHPNTLHLGSLRTLSDFFNIEEEDLK